MSRRYPVIEGELEDELAQELEDEFEDELEAHLSGELEGEFEDEDESLDEFEDELEAALGEFEGEFEDEDFADHEDEFEVLVRELEDEFEFEFEGEDEDEDFANPVRRVYSDAELMAELAMRAENAETEEEAEAFLGLAAPLALQAAKWALPKIIKHGPKLIRGAVSLGRRLWRNPATRHAVRQVPKIVARTAADMGRRYASGQPISGRHISRSLVGHTADAVAGRNARRRGRTGRPGRRHPAQRSASARRTAANRSTQAAARRRRARRNGGARRKQGKARARRR
ncbi:MAG TPA: hypothetical protein VFU43_06445 [Streptosporangiaceae bacterium]|nr:hypothetical protein [Streptosporangiaceae bacterium]